MLTQNKHTRGPWRIDVHSDRARIHLMGGDHTRIALLDDCHIEPEAAANRAVIKAAPDMLAALEAIENHIKNGCKGDTAKCKDIRKNAQAAIAKARVQS